MKTLSEIQDYLKSILPTGIDLALEATKAQLVEGTDKFNDLILLEGRYREVGRQLLQGVMSNEEAQIEFNKVRKDLLEFIDTLQDSQLLNTDNDPTDDRPDIYNGEVFYRIPSKMQLEQESKCIIRLAFDRKVLTEGLEVEEQDVLKDLRISEVMGVELIDAHGECFAIRTLNDAVQFVDKDLFTEWIYYVKPTATGTHPLTLKISIIEIKNGVERKRNVVLEEQVVVVTEPVEEGEVALQSAGYALQVGQANSMAPTPPSPAPSAPRTTAPNSGKPTAPPRSGGRSIRKLTPIIGGVFAVVFASWAAISGGFFDGGGDGPSPISPSPGPTPDPVDVVVTDPPNTGASEVITIDEFWEMTKMENTRDAYEEFVASVDDHPHTEAAIVLLDSIETAAFEDAMNSQKIGDVQMYLEEYPTGIYANKVKDRITKLKEGSRSTQTTASNEVEMNKGKKLDEKASGEKENVVLPSNPGKEKVTEPEESNKPISMQRASRKPIFPGCRNDKKIDKEEACTKGKIHKFLSGKLKYPTEAKRKGIEGTVQVVFVVEKDGHVTDVRAIRGPGGGCEEEAVRLVKALPQFEPGLNRAERPVRVQYHLPVTFKLR